MEENWWTKWRARLRCQIHPLDKNILFVTDNPSGVNKSFDKGTTWTQRNQGITTRTGPSRDGIPVFSLTIDPNNPNIVWAGTQSAKGIYKSIDGGETWVKKDKGVIEGDEISFRNFAVHPRNSNIVFAGAEILLEFLGYNSIRPKGKSIKPRMEERTGVASGQEIILLDSFS